MHGLYVRCIYSTEATRVYLWKHRTRSYLQRLQMDIEECMDSGVDWQRGKRRIPTENLVAVTYQYLDSTEVKEYEKNCNSTCA